jgi:hypothetical protein
VQPIWPVEPHVSIQPHDQVVAGSSRGNQWIELSMIANEDGLRKYSQPVKLARNRASNHSWVYVHLSPAPDDVVARMACGGFSLAGEWQATITLAVSANCQGLRRPFRVIEPRRACLGMVANARPRSRLPRHLGRSSLPFVTAANLKRTC